ncbi:hypothetical protein [Rhodovulum sp. BSW8]|uniref:hypothetical protein n=1 Tax=Rhodovulum sp. BSW8 TaxID=2259645 RepID=UPI001402122D|nr:hypothetical protein [Rhodovulum sp. BSW8]
MPDFPTRPSPRTLTLGVLTGALALITLWGGTVLAARAQSAAPACVLALAPEAAR